MESLKEKFQKTITLEYITYILKVQSMSRTEILEQARGAQS